MGIPPEKGEFPIEIRIGQPYPGIDGDWACPVAVDGLHARLADQHGAGSLQALMVAQGLARHLFKDCAARGGILKFEDGSPVVDVDRLFESGIV